MGEQITIKTLVDVWINNGTLPRFGTNRLYISTTSQAYVFNGFPLLPQGSQIISAILRIYAGPEVMADVTPPTLSAVALLEQWDISTVTWANKPDEGGVIDTANAPVDVVQGMWELDLTAATQAAVTGGSWYGFTLKSNEANPDHYWWASQSERPMVLDIEYTAPPAQPQSLSPNSNTDTVGVNKPVLSWIVPTAGGNGDSLYSFVVQVDDNASFSSPWSSGTLLGAAGTLDLSTTAFPAATAGVVNYWRVKVTNEAGMESPWSDAAEFVYQPRGVLNITTPSPMSDPSPVITWTLTGATQQAYQVQVLDPMKYTVMWDTGIVYGTGMSVEAPYGIWDYIGESYPVRVRVWDDEVRVGVPGTPTYVEKIKSIEYVAGGTAAPVEIQVWKPDPWWPLWVVAWKHTGPLPDYFAIRRQQGGQHVWVGDPPPAACAAPEIGAGWYKWFDDYVPNRVDVTWYALAVKAGVVSPWTTNVTQHPKGESATLISISDANRRLILVNYDIDPGLSEVTDVGQPMGGYPIIVKQKLNGYIGACTGRISNGIGGLSAFDMRNTYLWMRSYPRVMLTWADESIEAMIFDLEITPIPTADGWTDYQVEFQFVQIGGGNSDPRLVVLP